MFSLRLHFPILEMIWSNRPVALIRTPDGQTRPCKIKQIKGKYFVTRWGWFRMKQEYGGNLFKQKLYDYVGWNENPIDIRAMKELELFLKKTDRVALEKWMEEQDEKLLPQVEEQTEMNLHEEPELDKEGKPVVESGVVKMKPITQEKRKMVLRALREPVNTRVETWLMQFEKVDPSGTLTGIEKVISLKKLLHEMSNPITTKFPIIIAVVIAFTAIALITQGGNIMDHLFTGIHCMQSGSGCIGAK